MFDTRLQTRINIIMTYLLVVSKTSDASSRYFWRNRSPGAVSNINLLKKSVSDTKNANPMATRKRPCFQLICWSNGTDIRLPQAALNDAMLQPNEKVQLRCFIASIAFHTWDTLWARWNSTCVVFQSLGGQTILINFCSINFHNINLQQRLATLLLKSQMYYAR